MKNNFSKFRRLIFSQTAKDTYWVFGANILTAFLAFLYTIFLARAFSPADFGIFSAVFALMLLVSDVADLGIGSSLSRFLPPFYARKEKRKAMAFLKTSFLFQIKIAFLLSSLVLIFSSFLSSHLLKTISDTSLIIIAAFGIFGTILMAFATYVLSAQKKFQPVAILNSLSTLVKLLLIVLFYQLKVLNLFWVIIIFAFSSYAAYLVSLFFLPLKSYLLVEEEKGDLKKLLSFASFLGLSKIFSATASRLDALMLIPLYSSFEAGIYSAAFKIVSLYILLAASFSTVIAPRLSSFPSVTESLSYLRKVILVVLGILGTIIIMFFIAPWFVVFVLGDKYALSVPVFQALLLPMAFFTMTIPPVNFLLYVLKKPQVSAFNTFIQLFIIIIGNLIFVPKYGRFGPVITLTIAYSFTFFSASFFAFYLSRKNRYG